MLGPDVSAAPAAPPRHAAGIGREEAIHRGLRAVVRFAFARYTHGPAEAPPAGTFIAYVLPEAAQRVCEELRREDLHRPGPHGPTAIPRHDLRGSDGRFHCGHARVPENTYQRKSSPRCRTCAIKNSIAWNRAHRQHRREYGRAYRASHKDAIAARHARHHLAMLIYLYLRRLMIADGAWPLRGERGAEERSVA